MFEEILMPLVEEETIKDSCIMRGRVVTGLDVKDLSLIAVNNHGIESVGTLATEVIPPVLKRSVL